MKVNKTIDKIISNSSTEMLVKIIQAAQDQIDRGDFLTRPDGWKFNRVIFRTYKAFLIRKGKIKRRGNRLIILYNNKYTELLTRDTPLNSFIMDYADRNSIKCQKKS